MEMTQYLLFRPHSLIPLTTFAERYNSAKSSISEDLAIIKEVFEEEGLGELNTLAGAAGGVKFITEGAQRNFPEVYPEPMFATATTRTDSSRRIFVYVRYHGAAPYLNEIGKTFASAFAGRGY